MLKHCAPDIGPTYRSYFARLGLKGRERKGRSSGGASGSERSEGGLEAAEDVGCE